MSRKGLTLIETMIASALLAMMMTGLYYTLILSTRYQQRVHDSMDTFQRALIISNRLTAELGYGAADSLLVEDDGIAFLSARPPLGPFTHDVTGQLEWQGVVFFFVEGEELFMGEFPIAPTTTAAPPPSLASLRTDGRADIRLLAAGVTDFRVESGSGVDILFRVEGEAPEVERNAVTLRTRVTFRQ